jgi:Protein of unknown function (DUF1460)
MFSHQVVGQFLCFWSWHYSLLRQISFFIFFICAQATLAQQTTEQIFAVTMKVPLGANTAQTALNISKSLAGKSYAPHTLEQTPETLVCNLHQFDCYTLVENVVALALARKNTQKYADYQQFLLRLRYRNGILNGYGSRLHYFLEWAEQAQKNGYLLDITRDLGGREIQKDINFMTTHAALYALLADAPARQMVAEAEQKLSKKQWCFILKTEFYKIESSLQEGDIVAFTSSKAGLDFNHEGFVVLQNGRAHLLHASTDHRRVLVSTETLAQYLQKIKHHSGIVVLRLR